jgi:hypothetical protein
MEPAELEQQRIHYVRVTNGLKTAFTDRYDGVPVIIPPGKSTNLELSIAAHLLGYQPGVDDEAMFRHVSRRQGWNTADYAKPDDDDPDKTRARALFDKLKIEAVAYKMVPVDDPDPRKPIPADAAIPDDPPPSTFKDRDERRRKKPEASA